MFSNNKKSIVFLFSLFHILWDLQNFLLMSYLLFNDLPLDYFCNVIKSVDVETIRQRRNSRMNNFYLHGVIINEKEELIYHFVLETHNISFFNSDVKKILCIFYFCIYFFNKNY